MRHFVILAMTLIILVLVTNVTAQEYQDVIYLKSGEVLKGIIRQETANGVILESNGVILPILKDEIKQRTKEKVMTPAESAPKSSAQTQVDAPKVIKSPQSTASKTDESASQKLTQSPEKPYAAPTTSKKIKKDNVTELKLKDGRVVKGRLIETASDGRMTIELRDGSKVSYLANDIIKIRTVYKSGVSFGLYPFAHSFEWKEYNDSENELLTETGQLYGLGGNIQFNFRKFSLEGGTDFFYGEVDYDGQTQRGDPVKTTTEYWGYKMEAAACLKLNASSNVSFKPFVGYGIRWWIRSLQEVTGVIVYDETWTSFYGIAGLKGAIESNSNSGLFGRLSVNIPVLTSNEVTISDLFDEPSAFGHITMYPRIQPALYGELGAHYHRLGLSLFYEQQNYGKSPKTYVNIITNNGIFPMPFSQPKSNSSMIGARLTYTFSL